MPVLKVAEGGGHSPHAIAGTLGFQDRFGAVVQFTFRKSLGPNINTFLKWLSRRELHSRPLPSQGSALVSAELRQRKMDYRLGISPSKRRAAADGVQ